MSREPSPKRARVGSIDGPSSPETGGSDLIGAADGSSVDGWTEYFDTLAFKSYFYNPKSGETVWSLPEGATVIGKADEDENLSLLPPEEEGTTTAPEADVSAVISTAPQRKMKVIGAGSMTTDELVARAAQHRADEAERSAALERQVADAAGHGGGHRKREPVVEPAKILSLPPSLASLPPHLKVFIQHDSPPTAEELGRPARVQADPADFKNTAYTQGQEDYNIWYGKYASDRFGEGGRRERVPAATHCNLFKDAGFTRADSNPHLKKNPICIYFAKGCCTQGHNCQYYHRVPTQADSDNLDLMHDIFGRERHAQQRDDMEGVGSFNSSSTTLFVGDYKLDRMDGNFSSRIEQLLLSHFSIYGPLEDIRVIANRNFSFVTFVYRAAAEFAKVAMSNWRLESNDEVLTVKWAQSNRNPAMQARIAAREFSDAKRLVMQRLQQIAIEEEAYIAQKEQARKELLAIGASQEGSDSPPQSDSEPQASDYLPDGSESPEPTAEPTAEASASVDSVKDDSVKDDSVKDDSAIAASSTEMYTAIETLAEGSL